jgi:hypothetical protein
LKNIIRLLIVSVILICALDAQAQNDKEKIGIEQILNQTGALYNYGVKDQVNIEVNVWGYVKLPGKYIIPKGTTMLDLISYAGGPTVDSKLKEIRLFRPKNDSLNIGNDQIFKFNYNDLLWEEKPNPNDKTNISLKAGDILILPGEPKLFFRDNFTLVLAACSTLISLAILIVSIVRK